MWFSARANTPPPPKAPYRLLPSRAAPLLGKGTAAC